MALNDNYSIFQAATQIARWNDPHGDSFGVPANVSYSFYNGTRAFNQDQRDAALAAQELWADVAQINFFIDNADPEIAYRNMVSLNSDGTAASSGSTTDTGPGRFNPDVTHVVGFNLAHRAKFQLAIGEFGRQTINHELGHAVGLAHPADYNAEPDADPISYADDRGYIEDSQQYSIMSYFGAENTGADHDSDTGARIYSRTPLLHDIAAAQMLYGADMTTRTGNTVYGVNSNTGRPEYSINGEMAVFAIYDAGGTDTLDMSIYNVTQRLDGSNWVAYNQVINLNPGTFSDTGGLTKNMSMADAVDVNGNNSWEAGFDPNNIANYIENAIGGQARDVIFGNAAGNRLQGENGDDTLWGGNGSDNLFGGNNNDDLHGGDQDDVLFGNDGDDTLVGDAGADRMLGGAGNDVYVVNETGDTVSERAGAAAGTADKIYTTLSTYDMRILVKGNNVEIIQYTGTGTFFADGNALNNIMVGGSKADTLRGNEGKDTLYGGNNSDRLEGGVGDDVLDGGFGADIMVGGSGNDHYVVNTTADTIVEETGTAGGVDMIFTSLNFYNMLVDRIGRNVENLEFTGSFAFTAYGNELNNGIRGGIRDDSLNGQSGNDVLAGGDGRDTLDGGADDDILYGEVGDDTLTGSIGNDYLHGGTGADMMSGGAGNDVYIVDNANDVVSERLGTVNFRDAGGVDEVRTIRTTYVLASANPLVAGLIENLTFTGIAVFKGTGNDIANVIKSGAFADTLSGLGGDDVLFGGGGGDTLIGGLGADTLNGETGKDTASYAGSIAGVSVNLTNGIVSGGDAAGDSLSSIENLIGSSLADDLSGNDDENRLDGGDGADVIAGNGGADLLIGGKGDDFFLVDNLDTVRGGEGSDFVLGDSSTVATGFAFSIFGTSIEYVNGNLGNDSIDATGVLTDVTLVGGVGNDNLTGGQGNDALFGFGAPSGLDGNDTLSGGAGNDRLIGGGGDDILIGGNGNDTIEGEAGADRFDVADGWGFDTISDFNFSDGDRIDMSDVTGLDNFAQLLIADNGGAQISFAGEIIHLTGISLSDVQADWFIF